MLKKERISLILKSLEDVYQGTATALDYNSTFELLIAVILSAQCTDERVNIVTKRLFPDYNAPDKLGALTITEMEALIHDCGLYKSKAKNILKTCRLLVEQFNGQVPDNLEDLMTLPGVGKKTANVMLSVAFGIPAIAVDTHVFRVSHRLGLAKGKDPLAVEQELMKVIPKNKWGDAHHWLIWHGRKVCKARKPLCANCTLINLCPYKEKNI
ncbi:MAG TPA: endonuclease III [Candidatus Avacidaminococcus intestinavium]|uniref:Endonuclease III n=1 Tax=Candidatus Avacidaminococcus intestinavium TaxID=2840684 RepID=A0A9D1MPG2_9FIRM|nr:endonuclease III [Candidatus Avacidaminococcus intestinavium]